MRQLVLFAVFCVITSDGLSLKLTAPRRAPLTPEEEALLERQRQNHRMARERGRRVDALAEMARAEGRDDFVAFCHYRAQDCYRGLNYIARVAQPRFAYTETIIPDSLYPEGYNRVRAAYTYSYRAWGLRIEWRAATSHHVVNAVWNLIRGRDPETMKPVLENILVDLTAIAPHFEGHLWFPFVVIFIGGMLQFLYYPWVFFTGLVAAVLGAIAVFKMSWVWETSAFQFRGSRKTISLSHSMEFFAACGGRFWKRHMFTCFPPKSQKAGLATKAGIVVWLRFRYLRIETTLRAKSFFSPR